MSDVRILLPQANYENLRFYQKTDVLYRLTFAFTQRYLQRGDRTIDQMVQAARSGKQNIVEGSADGVTSKELEIKLLNVARASIRELREDYEDYLNTRQLRWTADHPRYKAMVDYCKKHNRPEEYAHYIDNGTDEEMANLGLTLTHQVDVMMTKYLQHLEETFKNLGGVKERMTAARLGQRKTQYETIAEQAREIAALKARIQQLENELKRYKGEEAGEPGLSSGERLSGRPGLPSSSSLSSNSSPYSGSSLSSSPSSPSSSSLTSTASLASNANSTPGQPGKSPNP